MRDAKAISKIQFRLHTIFRVGCPAIKVVGSFRTGSNLLEKLCFENLRVRIPRPTRPFWKHGRPLQAKDLSIWAVYREPASWIESFYRWERAHMRTEALRLSDFCGEVCKHPLIQREFGKVTPWEYYVAFHHAWLEFEPCHFITMDTVLTHPKKVLEWISLSTSATLAKKATQPLTYKADWWRVPRPELLRAHPYDSDKKEAYVSKETFDLARMVRAKCIAMD